MWSAVQFLLETLVRFRRDKLAVAGLVTIAVFVIAACGAHWFAPYDPAEQFFDGLTLEGAPLPPGLHYWFGTDTNGRDQFSRLLYGAQTSLLIGIVANGIAVGIGSALGMVAGYMRGWLGASIMRVTDLMMAFPPLLLAIALAAILKPGLSIIILVIALVNWVQIARVVYAETVSLSEREHIEAARALGATSGRILWRHLLPHLIPTIIVYATLGIATTVLLESMLSFLGRGVQPPTPAWGMMIFESQSYFLNAPWLVFIPGAAILAGDQRNMISEHIEITKTTATELRSKPAEYAAIVRTEKTTKNRQDLASIDRPKKARNKLNMGSFMAQTDVRVLAKVGSTSHGRTIIQCYVLQRSLVEVFNEGAFGSAQPHLEAAAVFDGTAAR